MTGPAVLVVDDNEVNRTVLRCMLQGLGLPPQEAADGGAAARLAGITAFELIFMDCMMPEMDGLAATAAIRRGGASRRAWIVAVTANTLVHDRERCLAAGMDDYIAKPFTLDILRRALGRWGERRQPPWLCPGPPAARGEDGPETDFTALQQLHAIAGAGAVAEVVGVFLRESAGLIARLQEAGSDPGPLRSAGHRIKGACGSVGLVRAQRLAARIEARAQAGDGDGAEGCREELIRSLRDGCRSLQGLLADGSGGHPPPPR